MAACGGFDERLAEPGSTGKSVFCNYSRPKSFASAIGGFVVVLGEVFDRVVLAGKV